MMLWWGSHDAACTLLRLPFGRVAVVGDIRSVLRSAFVINDCGASDLACKFSCSLTWERLAQSRHVLNLLNFLDDIRRCVWPMIELEMKDLNIRPIFSWHNPTLAELHGTVSGASCHNSTSTGCSLTSSI